MFTVLHGIQTTEATKKGMLTGPGVAAVVVGTGQVFERPRAFRSIIRFSLERTADDARKACLHNRIFSAERPKWPQPSLNLLVC